MTDIVGTFRSYALDKDNLPRMASEVIPIRVGLLLDAASTIETLRAEVERLKVENEAVLSANRDVMLHWDVLKADYEKLRTALKEVMVWSKPHDKVHIIARTALEEKHDR